MLYFILYRSSQIDQLYTTSFKRFSFDLHLSYFNAISKRKMQNRDNYILVCFLLQFKFNKPFEEIMTTSTNSIQNLTINFI